MLLEGLLSKSYPPATVLAQTGTHALTECAIVGRPKIETCKSYTRIARLSCCGRTKGRLHGRRSDHPGRQSLRAEPLKKGGEAKDLSGLRARLHEALRHRQIEEPRWYRNGP